MPTYQIPIEGLSVPTTWVVGPVRVRPSPEFLGELAERFPDNPFADRLTDFVREVNAKAVAEVAAADIDSAIDVVSQAVDVLRVFQHMGHFRTALGHFGLPGDVSRRAVHYAQLDTEPGSLGFRYRGAPVGWTFKDPDEWSAAGPLREIAEAIGQSEPSEGMRRALIGIQLLSDALVEQRGTPKMVALVTALEAWLLPRHGGGQTFRLARAVAYFGCGRHADDLCGRSRDTCPYLELDPTRRDDLNRLKTLRKQGATPPWRCGEWHRVVDWYDLRSDVVHGAGPNISYREASNALFWTARYLTEPILQWLVMHPTHPIQALDEALDSLPPAPDWEARLGTRLGPPWS